MDWDWEDRPPKDPPQPRRAADEPDAERDLAGADAPPEAAEPESSLGATEQEPEPESPQGASPFQELPPLDAVPDYVVPARAGSPTAGDAPLPEREGPSVRTVEAAERAIVGAERRDRDQYRPRTAEDRAAARAQRRRRLRQRRLIALAVVVAIVVLLVVLVVRGCGGSDAAAAVAAFAVPIVERRLLVATERA
ncbi:MAG: hypothetical protein ACM3MJ_04495 [Deltaproteobacteria bacterium]